MYNYIFTLLLSFHSFSEGYGDGLGVDFISQSYISLEILALNTFLRMFVLIKNKTLFEKKIK